MNWLLDPLITLLGLGLLLAFTLAIASPFEALGWWAGWSERQLDPHRHITLPQPLPGTPDDVEGYVVYLTGIGGYSGEFLARREMGFIERLEARLAGRVEIIHDVFPFSVSNNPLNGERVFGWIWEKQQKKITVVNTVPMKRTGRGNYFDRKITKARRQYCRRAFVILQCQYRRNQCHFEALFAEKFIQTCLARMV